MALKVIIPLLVTVAAGFFAFDFVNKKKKSEGDADGVSAAVSDATAAVSDATSAAKKTVAEVKAAVSK